MNIDEQVKHELHKMGVKLTVTYVGATDMDNWAFTLSRGHAKYSSHFHTGLGLRVKGNPVKPSEASILYSLFSDARANEFSFADWCDEYGFNDDSISALDMYRACCGEAKGLRKVFSSGELSELEEILAEY